MPGQRESIPHGFLPYQTSENLHWQGEGKVINV